MPDPEKAVPTTEDEYIAQLQVCRDTNRALNRRIALGDGPWQNKVELVKASRDDYMHRLRKETDDARGLLSLLRWSALLNFLAIVVVVLWLSWD